MEGKRIVLCSHELTYTGAPHSLLRICKVLQKNGAYVELWSREDGPFRNEFEAIKVFVRIVPNNEISSNETKKRIQTFDLAIINTVISHKFYLAARDLIPTIWYIREAHNLPEISDHVKERYNALKTADELYCVSEYAQEFIQKTYNANVKVVHNCVEDYYKGNPNRVIDKVNFAVIGTLTYRKAFDICIDAFQSLPKELQEKAHMYFAGRLIDYRSDYWKPILSVVEKNPNITYVGEIENTEDKISFFEGINVFIVVSRDESCSLVVLEGAMMGKPVIVSENVGAKYLIDDKSGWLVKTGDVESLKKTLEYIILNPNCVEIKGKQARIHYENTSTIAIYEKNITDMVKEKLTRGVKQEYLKRSSTSLAYQLEHAEKENDVKSKNFSRKISILEKDLKVQKVYLTDIQNSTSFKIGRGITWLPRKVRGGYRCIKEHGLLYTAKYCVKKCLGYK